MFVFYLQSRQAVDPSEEAYCPAAQIVQSLAESWSAASSPTASLKDPAVGAHNYEMFSEVSPGQARHWLEPASGATWPGEQIRQSLSVS